MATVFSGSAVAVVPLDRRNTRALLMRLLLHRSRLLQALAPSLFASPPMLVGIPVSSLVAAD